MAIRVNLALALIQLSGQFALISGNNPFIPLGNDWMSNYLLSSFTSSTDVLFIIDNTNFFTSGVSGYVFQLFSHQKTFRVVTMNDWGAHAVWNCSGIEKRGQASGLESESSEDSQTKYSSTLITTPRWSGKFCYEDIKVNPGTSLVIVIKDFILMSMMQDVISKNPSGLKILFLYDECTPSPFNLERKIEEFSRVAWSQLRVLFTYFIPVCSRAWELDLANMSRPHPFRSVSIPNRQEINNRMGHESFINSLFVYDPFYLSNSRKGSDSNDQNYGTLRKINLSQDYGRMEGILRNKIVKINGYHLRIVFYPTTMAVLKTEIPFMSRNLTPEILTNPTRTTESYFGLEIEVLKELAKRMNFTPDIWPSSDGLAFGFKNENNTFNGAIGDIIYNRADFGMNGYFIKDYETREVEFTTAFSDDKVCILVKSPQLIPNSLLLFKVFSPALWLLIVCTVVAASTFYTFLLFVARKCNFMDFTAKQRSPFKTSNKRYNEILTMIAQCTRIIAVLLTTPHYYRFSGSRCERIFAAFCLWWGLNMIGAFQGSLVDVYTNQLSYPRMYTLEEFDRSGLKIAVKFPGLIKDVFGNNDGEAHLGNLRKKMYPSEDNDVITNIASNGNLATLARQLDLNKFTTMIPYGTDGKFPLYYISECPRTYTIAYLFPRSSIYLSSVNFYLTRFASAGLLVKWQKDTEFIFQLAGQLKNRWAIKESLTILTVSHLQLAFFVLLFGYFSSFLVFIVEIYWERKRK